MTGHSEQGPDEKEQHDFLVREFSKVIESFKNSNVTQVSDATLETNYGIYDLISKKEVSKVS